jgi:hypothetical protein
VHSSRKWWPKFDATVGRKDKNKRKKVFEFGHILNLPLKMYE